MPLKTMGCGCECEEIITACSGITFIATAYDLELEISGGTYSSECDAGCDLNGTYLLTWDAGISRYSYSATLPGTCVSNPSVGKKLQIRILPACGGGRVTLTSGHLSSDWGLATFLAVGEDDNNEVCMHLKLATAIFFADTTPAVGEWSSTVGVTDNGTEHVGTDCACLGGTDMSVRARFV